MASEKGVNSATPECPTIDYKQPDSSPYEDPFVTLLIGRKEYAVPRCYLRAYSQFQTRSENSLYVRLLDIEEDIGHTVVHFLYTGRYETLNTAPSKGIYDIPKEFRRSVQVYRAALTYRIHGLEALAKRYIEILSHSVSIYYILDTARTVFSKIPGDGAWIRDYLYTQLRRAFCLDERIFDHDGLYKALGNDLSFTKAVIKMIFTLYNDRISSLQSLRGQERQIESIANRQAKEQPAEVYTVEDKQQPEQEQREAEGFAKQKQEDKMYKKKQEEEKRKWEEEKKKQEEEKKKWEEEKKKWEEEEYMKKWEEEEKKKQDEEEKEQ